MLARERIKHFAVLGIRFWDQTKDAQIGDSLQVSAWREGSADRVVVAERSASGIYVFHRLPGLRESEIRGDDEPDFEQPLDLENAARRSYIVEVKDNKGRFLPVARRVDLPLPRRGLLFSSGPSRWAWQWCCCL